MKIAPQIRALLLAMLFVLVRSSANAQTLPLPWANTDIGSPATAGRATLSSGTFTITAAGSDIWGTSDQFHFVYQPVTGDVEIMARVVSITTTAHRWSKAGVMIRESLTAESRHAMMVGSAGAGYAFQRRVNTAGNSDSTAGPASAPPGWVRLVRKGDLFSAYYSTNGTSWQLVGSDTIPMGDTVYVGLPVTSHSKTVSATARIDSVKLTAASLPNSPPAVSVTAPIANTQYTTPASIAISATATDPEGAMLSVDFYANQTLISRDTTTPYSATFATSTAGTYSLTAVAHDADGNSTTSGPVPVTVGAPSNGLPSVALTSPAAGATFAAPATINLAANATDPENQLARVEFLSGTTVVGTDTAAPYSFSWTNVPAGTYSLTAKAYDSAGASAISAPVSVTVSSSSGLPAGQAAVDIGSPTVAGRTTYSSGTYTISGAGQDIWDAADQFHFLYAQANGDVEIVARVASLTNTNSWAKAGVMIRESLTAGSRHASMFMTAGSGNAFQRRPQTNGMSEHTAGSAGVAPGWVRLVRSGSVIQAYESSDGATWRSIGSTTIQMTTAVYVGLAVTSHNTSTATTAKLDNVAITAPSGNKPPVVTFTSPANGATFSAPASIPLAATATDAEGPIARVEFYSGTTLLWTESVLPYADSWTNVPAGTYTLTAVAYDGQGAKTTSAPVTVTVNGTNKPPTVTLTSPANGTTLSAPATISMTASASDPENQLARVEFLSGTTVLAADTTAPYAWSWSNVAAGTYTLTAKAYDSAGAVATSVAVTVTVSGTNQPPTVTLTSPASGATFTAPATINFAANASDPENQLARVEFYSGTTRLGTDTTAPYTFSWSSVAAGTYTLTAKAFDAAGLQATSAAVSIVVGVAATAPTAVVFTASADHATNVTSYRLAVYASTANPATATPIATSDLGKPTPNANNEITVDRASFFTALPVGNYLATVTAIGPGGQTPSSSVAFSR